MTMPNVTRHMPAVLILLLAFATPLAAQSDVPLPDGWTADVRTVLERFRAGDRLHPEWIAISRCPNRSPYGDRLWTALLAEAPTPRLISRLSVDWTIAMRNCRDPRIAAWWRQRLVQYRHNASLAQSAVLALSADLSPENLTAIKRYTFDEDVDPRARSTVLFVLGRNWTAQETMSLYFETLRHTRTMPEPYGYDTFYKLVRSPVADEFVLRSLEWVEREPAGKNPARVLVMLATDREVARSRTWRSRLDAALVRIEANASGRYPAEVVATARSHRDLLSRTPID
jgi:hypothetical protein